MNNEPETAWAIPTKTTQPASQTATIKPLKPLTRKQQAYVQHLIDNPKSNPTQAVLHAYNIKNPNNSTARTVAHELQTNPNILLELSKYSRTAELVQIRLLETSSKYSETGTRDGASYATVALNTSQAILDRLHGKATTRVEQQTTTVTLNIDLTGPTSVSDDVSSTT